MSNEIARGRLLRGSVLMGLEDFPVKEHTRTHTYPGLRVKD